MPADSRGGWTVSFILARNYVFRKQRILDVHRRHDTFTAALGAFVANQTVLEIATRVANHLVIAQLVASNRLHDLALSCVPVLGFQAGPVRNRAG